MINSVFDVWFVSPKHQILTSLACVSVVVFLCRRIFVNRSLTLENIKCYGFDMDYTMASRCTNGRWT